MKEKKCDTFLWEAHVYNYERDKLRTSGVLCQVFCSFFPNGVRLVRFPLRHLKLPFLSLSRAIQRSNFNENSVPTWRWTLGESPIKFDKGYLKIRVQNQQSQIFGLIFKFELKDLKNNSSSVSIEGELDLGDVRECQVFCPLPKPILSSNLINWIFDNQGGELILHQIC